MGDAFFLKKIYEPAQLSQLQPQKIIAAGGEGRIRIGKKSRAYDADARGPRVAGHCERKDAAAGDDAQSHVRAGFCHGVIGRVLWRERGRLRE